ncbi:concanavalin A-like lectin/glucanase domain-containing protein [Talaromyces proteolyticus]|uniref:Concanavalin A-like lectin/glucanase domain-containing protein n=1 Tax=Talaromyces proteolyticus TaxID=1131652 RepID=A0AAD4PUA9_9EURO|nr:concanavalin A-like lectin/glucanase domain-containing protein [Talaromyces proteolyticus]KAH8694901.1 concanavalin A-like lectin/glucanase domain-containing protein [Talaromyces proteolyticus]
MNLLSSQGGETPPTDGSSLPTSSYLAMAFVMAEKGLVLEEEEFKLLPSRWSNAGKSPTLDLLNDGLEIRYMGPPLHFTVAGVRTDYPIPRQLSFYYFEVTIITISNERAISIGVSNAKVFDDPILFNRARHSWDYVGNDDKPYVFLGLGRVNSPTLTVNDTVGCGVDFTTGYSFFTKNGTFLGSSFRIPQDVTVYPSVFIEKIPGTHLSVNFGQQGFVFDVDGMLKVCPWEHRYRTNLKH